MKIINYEQKEITPLTYEENNNKMHAIYIKKSFVQINMMKIMLIEKRLKITAIIQENLEQLLIANVTYKF